VKAGGRAKEAEKGSESTHNHLPMSR
jgi:hypothetical protein